jgi:autotransporter-associated beta strand protein
MHPLRILNLSHVVFRTCFAVLMSFLLMPGLAHALTFAPVQASMPVTIPPPTFNGNIALAGFCESGIKVAGINTSIKTVKCGVWLTYPTIGNLAVALTSPGIGSTTVLLADQEGQQDTGNNNAGGLGGLGGAGLGGGVGGGGIGTTGANGSYGIGAGIAPGGEVQFDDTATQSIDQFRGGNVDSIPSGTYTCTTQPGWFLGTTAANVLANFAGKGDLNVNGTWFLDVYNFDIVFVGFAGGTTTGQETGTINWWTLEIDEVGVHVWTGAAFGGFGSNWSLDTNWSNGAPQITEERVVLDFPSVAAQYITVNDIPAGLNLGQVTIDGNYTISGGAANTTGNAVFQNLGGVSTWAIDLALGWPLNGMLDPNGSTKQATGITIDVFSGQLTMSGVISGGTPIQPTTRGPTTITTEGPGTLILSGANTYIGVTNINSGILDAQSATALGAIPPNGAGTFVAIGATLQLGIPGAALPFANFNEPLSIASVGYGGIGALEVVGTGALTYTGAITLASDDAAVGAVAGATLNLNGQLIGGGLIFEGLGILNINVALPGANLITNGGTINLPIANQIPILGVNNGGAVNAAATLTVLDSITAGPSATTNTITGNLIIGIGPRVIDVGLGTAIPSLRISGGSLSGPGAINQIGIGDCELDCTVGAPAVAYTVNQGILSGTAALGSLNVLSGAVVQPGIPAGTGNMTTTGGANLSAGSLYVAQLFGGAVPAQLQVGTVLNLSGAIANGAGGAYLSPVGITAPPGTALTIITYGTLTPSAFVNRPYPASFGTTYGVAGQGGAANCVQLTLDGSTVALVNSTYTLSKAAGNVPIAVIWGGTVAPNASSDLVAVPGTAVQFQDFNQPSPTPLLESAGTNFTLPIVQNYIAEGNTLFSLLLVPMGETTAAHGNSAAGVTIIDNQNSGYEKKRCGIGSGFTVFFLFAIGLALRVLYLRRR